MKITPAFLALLFLLIYTEPALAQSPSNSPTTVKVTVATNPPTEEEALEEVSDELIEISTTSGDVVAEEVTVNYTLPYPGMLPDHPLYFLKSIRDSIIGVLISDPLKKAEFHLLAADKQIASAQTLADKDKDELAQKSIEKAKANINLALVEIQKSRDQKKDYIPLRDRIKSAALKHEEVLKNIDEVTGEDIQKTVDDYQAYLEKVNQNLPK